MASSLSTTCFRPYARARNPRDSSPKNRTQRRDRNRNRPVRELKVTTRRGGLSSVGAEATTFTRLPPREDFVLSGGDASSLLLQFSDVVKFSDSAAAPRREQIKMEEDDEDEEEDGVEGIKMEDEDEEEEGIGDDLQAKYGKYEVFEVGSDGEEEEEGVEEEEDWKGLGNGGDALGSKAFEGFDYDEIDVKEKGIPAVMRCFDRAKIFVKAGDGGNGVVAFRREKFVPYGGPSGGDGGRGGDVYVEVDGEMNSLLPFRNSVHFRAGRGSHGQGKMMAGAKGEDVIVKVAPGTVVRAASDDGSGQVLLELVRPGQRGLLLPGGRGGRGNASFKSGGNKVPRIAENGEIGPEMWLELELKLVADVGIVGAPNAGKSTLLSVISAAQPAIANYPFTTLLPNLGVVSFDYDSTLVVADLPGLLEGAHRGFGLGHEFLRHTERCSVLVHVVDGSSQQPELEFEAVRLELELFSPEIAEKPFVVAFNKMDIPEARENWSSFKEFLRARGIEPFCMSAIQRDGTHDVICAAHKLLQERKASTVEFDELGDSVYLDHVAEMVRKQRTVSINEFEVSRDTTTDSWIVTGAGLERFVQMTNWRYVDSDRRFQHVLEACGVNKSLMKQGVKEGDTVIVGEMEMVWHDSPDSSLNSNMRRKSGDSIKWADWKQ